MSSELQDIIVKEMKVKPSIDSESEVHELIHFIKHYVQSHGFIQSLVSVSYTHLTLPTTPYV